MHEVAQGAAAGRARSTVEAMKEALGALHKAIRFRRMYPPTHEFYKKVLGELEERLLAALAEAEEVTLEVGPQSFTLGGETVFTDERGHQNLPFRFYKDGIQTITFKVGVSQDELARLLDALQVDFDAKGAAGDDLAINLWNANLEKIAFYAVDELDPESARGERAEDEEAVRPGARELGARVEALVAKLGEDALPASAAELAAAPGFVRQLSVGERDILELRRTDSAAAIEEHKTREEADAEAEALAEESSVELAEMRESAALTVRTIEIVRWLVERGEFRDADGRVARLIWGLLERYIDEGRLDILNRALAELRIGTLRAQGDSKAYCQKLAAGIGDPERLEALVRLVNSRKAEEKELAELLQVMPTEALAVLAQRYSKLRSESGRKIVLQAIMDASIRDPHLLAPIVCGDDPEAALSALRALRAAADLDWAIPMALKGLASPHAEVRAEALRSIPQDRLDEHVDELALRLADPSPTVRGMAARRIALAGTAAAIAALRARLEVAGLPIEERVGLLRALAIADPTAADVLWAEAGARRKRFGFLPQGELDPLRRELIGALRNVATPAARNYLERCLECDDRWLRQAATADPRAPSHGGGGDPSRADRYGSTGEIVARDPRWEQ